MKTYNKLFACLLVLGISNVALGMNTNLYYTSKKFESKNLINTAVEKINKAETLSDTLKAFKSACDALPANLRLPKAVWQAFSQTATAIFDSSENQEKDKDVRNEIQTAGGIAEWIKGQIDTQKRAQATKAKQQLECKATKIPSGTQKQKRVSSIFAQTFADQTKLVPELKTEDEEMQEEQEAQQKEEWAKLSRLQKLGWYCTSVLTSKKFRATAVVAVALASAYALDRFKFNGKAFNGLTGGLVNATTKVSTWAAPKLSTIGTKLNGLRLALLSKKLAPKLG